MKLYLEINNQTYYLGQSHKRQALKTYDDINATVLTLLAANKRKFKTYQVQAKDVKATLYDGTQLKIKVSVNNNDYLVESQDVSQQDTLATVNSLIKQATKDV